MVNVENVPEIYSFDIAELLIRIVFNNPDKDNLNLIRPFKTFITDNGNGLPLFTLTVHEDKFVAGGSAENIGTFDTGNGETIVEATVNDGYRFTIKDIKGNVCCTLTADKKFTTCQCKLEGGHQRRCFGLNNALMLCFAFAGCFKQALLIHASLIRNNGYGYAFIAKSGTGKSTHTSLWLKYIPGCDLMNDDNPIVRIIEGRAYIYGSPWSGKTPCYRNVKAPLGAITRIERASQNSIERLKPVQAFASLLPSCSSMKWDSDIYNAICDNITKIIETVKIYTLHCLPDENAALLCHREISK